MHRPTIFLYLMYLYKMSPPHNLAFFSKKTCPSGSGYEVSEIADIDAKIVHLLPWVPCLLRAKTGSYCVPDGIVNPSGTRIQAGVNAMS